MKRTIVVTIAAVMVACVLPMAQGQESAPSEVKHVTEDEVITVTHEEQGRPSQDQLSRDIAKLQMKLEQLMAQQQDLQKQLQALAQQRDQMRAGGGQPRESAQRTGMRPRRERMEGESDVVSPESSSGPRDGQRTARETREELRRVKEDVKRAQEEARRAEKDAAKARAEAEHAMVYDQKYAEQMQAWAKKVEQWEQSDAMKKWERDMEQWGNEMGRWGQKLASRQMEGMDQSAEGSEVPEMAPMPVMPPMPPMPAAPDSAEVNVNVDVQASPHPMPMPRPHSTGGGVPHVVLPHMPAVQPPAPPAPPAIPEKEVNQEEAVSRIEKTIDLPAGRLLQVKNEMGSIVVRGGDEPGCRLVATIRGRAETMEEARRIVDQTELIIEPSDDRVSISTTKPEKENERGQVSRVVTMELVVPHDARISLGQAFGDIQLKDLDGSIKAVSNMGSIQAAGVRGRVALESNFGSIDFLAPRDFSAKVQAKSDFGSIQSDLPLEFAKSDAFSMGSKASGTIGDGEGEVALKTNMGSIRIRSQASQPPRAERNRPEPRPEAEF